MSVSGPGPVQGGIPVRPLPPATPPVKHSGDPPLVPKDELEISSIGKMLDELQQSGLVRADRLATIKSAIDAGEYETPQKLEAALTRLLAEVRAEAGGNSEN